MSLSMSRVFICVCFLSACQATVPDIGELDKTTRIDHLVFSPDSNSVAYSAHDKLESHAEFISRRLWDIKMGLWDIKTGTVKNLSKKSQQNVQTLFFSPNGEHLALMYSNYSKTNYGYIWDIKHNQLSEKQSYMPDYLGPTSLIAISPDKKFTAQPDSKGRIRLWNNSSKKIIKTYSTEHLREINAMQFTADGNRLVVVGQYKHAHRYYNVKDNKYQGPTLLVAMDLSGHSEDVVLDTKCTFLDIQKQTGRLLTQNENKLGVWDSVKQVLIQKINYIGSPSHTRLSRDGRFLAAVIHSDLIILPRDKPIEMANRHVAVIWDIKTALPLHVLIDETGEISSLAISPDSKTIATGNDKGLIRLWNIQTGKMIRQMAVQTKEK